MLSTNLALLSVAALLLAGCGGHERTAAERGTCNGKKMAAYGATVVAGFYKQGKLGRKSAVEHQLEAWGAVGSGKTFFDSRGNLIPYDKLSYVQQTAFRHWMYGGHVDAVTNVHAEIAAQLPNIKAECR